jgi:trimeric autotransporter adhesin
VKKCVTSAALSILVLSAAAVGATFPAISATAATAAPVTCQMPKLAGISAPSLVYVGDQPAVTVQLSCAPTKAISLAAASSSTLVPVPAAVPVAAGEASVIIPLSPQASRLGQYSAVISVSFGPTTLSTSITVDPGLASVSIPPTGGAPNMVFFDVLLTGPAPAGGLTVQIASDSSAVTMPATITIQAGGLGAFFNATSVQDVSQDTTVTLSATLGSTTLTASTVLLPPFTTGDTMTLANENSTGPVYGQDNNLEYTLTLSNPAPDAGLNVVFTAGSKDIELQETSDFITGGFTDGFTFINVASVNHPVHTSITADAGGVSTSLPITIEPGLTSVSVPATIVGGQGATGTISLAGKVDTDTTVNLQSSWGVLTVPLSVTIPAGKSSATFPITTVGQSSGDQVFVSASLGTTTIESTAITLS